MTGRLVTQPLRYDSSRYLAPDDDDAWLRTLTPKRPVRTDGDSEAAA